MKATEKLGKEIRKRRLELGLSQEDLAGITEVDRSYLSELETGKKNPSFDTLLRLTVGLEIKLSTLLKSIGQ